MKPSGIHLSVFLLVHAVLLSSAAAGKNQVIEIDHSPMQVNIDEITVPPHIQLSVIEGDVSIRSHNLQQIQVDIEGVEEAPDAAKAFLLVDSANGRITLSLGGPFSDSDVELSIPESASISVSSIDGDIEIEGLQGDIDCSTMDGSIELNNISGRVSASSKDGDIAIRLNDRITSSPISASTEDGDIELGLPADPQVRIKASTMDGDISCDFPIGPLQQKNADGRKRKVWKSLFDEHTLNGAIGEGTLPVQLNTLDGDITIVRSNFQSNKH